MESAAVIAFQLPLPAVICVSSKQVQFYKESCYKAGRLVYSHAKLVQAVIGHRTAQYASAGTRVIPARSGSGAPCLPECIIKIGVPATPPHQVQRKSHAK
jgi:hypothetical protein